MTDLEKKLNEHASATLGSYSGLGTGGRLSENQKIRNLNNSKDRENDSRNLFEEEKKKQDKWKEAVKPKENKLKPIPKVKPLAPLKPSPQLKKL